MQTNDMRPAPPTWRGGSIISRLAPSWRVGALTLAVLAAHLAALSELPGMRAGSSPGQARAAPMLTRTLPPPQPAPAAEAPVATPPPVARPLRVPAAKTAPLLPAKPATAGRSDVTPARMAAASSVAASPAQTATALAGAARAAAPDIGPVAVAPPTQLHYRVNASTKGLEYTAHAELLWQHDGAQYDARLTITAFLLGARTQTSVGQLTPQGLAPRRFADRRRGEKAAHFDRARQRITFSANTPEIALLPGAQDRLSLFLQLGALLGGAPARHGPGTVVTVQTAGTRDAEPWLFTVQSPVRLRLEGQSVDAIPLLRQPRQPYDSRVEIWLAPSLHYLPARLRITQSDGDELDLQLTRATPVPLGGEPPRQP